MPWTDPATHAQGYLTSATDWNALVNNMLFLAEVNYTEFTADVTSTATTVATATQIVTAGAITYEAVPHLIEFFSPRFTAGVAQAFVILRDGSTVIGTMGSFPASSGQAVGLDRRLTPTAASHSYNVAVWNQSAATTTVKAGTGGTAGDATTHLPGFIRITRLPT